MAGAAAGNVRELIGKRLQAEMDRKGFVDTNTLAQRASLSVDIVHGYLAAQREIQFSELTKLCDALYLDLMWLLSAEYQTPHLQYRLTATRDPQTLSEIEWAFSLLADFLPEPTLPKVRPLPDNDRDRSTLFAEVIDRVRTLREKYQTVEGLYGAANLSVLPFKGGDNAFDAFLLTIGSRSLVCLNRDRPPTRIHFSLLHEFAHALFHRTKDLPLDMLPEDVLSGFTETLQPHQVKEFVANKFAQEYLFPLEEAERLLGRNAPSSAEILSIARERRTSSAVIRAAFQDAARFKGVKLAFGEVDVVAEPAMVYGTTNPAKEVVGFLDQRGDDLRRLLLEKEDEFSPSIFESLMKAWGFAHE